MEKSGDVKCGAAAVDASSNHLKPSGLGRSVSSPQCIREAKDQHIRTFLATMAFEEEDQGIMENTASNSTSEFSSPLSLTPPDVEGVLTTLMRRNGSKGDHKEGDFEQREDGEEEGSKAGQGMEENDERDVQEEGAILTGVIGRRRNSDLPVFSPKTYSSPEDAFFAGKRASIAEVHIFVHDTDSDKVASVEGSLAGVAETAEPALSVEEVEEDRETIEDQAMMSQRLSQSQSFPEELNTMEGQDEEASDIHLTARQHRRSRSELQMNEITAEMANKENSSLPITSPQIESVRERVKEMEKQTVGVVGSSTLTEPAVGNWYKRVFSAPSLHTVPSGMCSTPPHEMAVAISRPSSRTSNWEEIAEETEEEAVTFTASDEAGSSLTSPCEQAMECGQPEAVQCENSDRESAVSCGQVTGQVAVEEKRPSPSMGLCWEPVHSRSQSNVESSSVKALIQTLEKRTKPLHASMQSLVRSDDSHKGAEEGEEGVSQGKAHEDNEKETEGGMGRCSGCLLENTQQQGCVVKRTQSLSALYWTNEQGAALPGNHAAVKKHDSFPLSMANGAPQLAIPEIESTDGISKSDGVPSRSEDSDSGNLVEMETLSASVLELTQKFEEKKPKPPPQMKHSFSSSSGATHKTCTSRPVSSDEDRGKSASPCPASVDPSSPKA